LNVRGKVARVTRAICQDEEKEMITPSARVAKACRKRESKTYIR
jgi:hypothetical protein